MRGASGGLQGSDDRVQAVLAVGPCSRAAAVCRYIRRLRERKPFMGTTIQATSVLHALQTASSSDLRAKVSQAGVTSAGADVRAATQGPTAKEIVSDVSAYYYAREHSDEVTYTRAGLVPTERRRVLANIQENIAVAVEGMKEEYGRFLDELKSQEPDLAAKYMKFGLGFTRFGFSLDTKGELVATGFDLSGNDKNRLTKILNQDAALKKHVVDFFNFSKDFEIAAGWVEGSRITPESFSVHDIGGALENSIFLSSKTSNPFARILNLSIHNININSK